ncbi:hypothetical protein [Laspinema olomoucense]|nr:hypothetical protein [Laspinema sp. D3a]MCT7990614.1 hypothetical protein [Laspinema sp. D3a]
MFYPGDRSCHERIPYYHSSAMVKRSHVPNLRAIATIPKSSSPQYPK